MINKMVGREITWDDERGSHRGIVTKAMPAVLFDVVVRKRLDAVRFEVKTKKGRLIYTPAVRPVAESDESVPLPRASEPLSQSLRFPQPQLGESAAIQHE